MELDKIYNPTPSDFLNWLNSGSEEWLASDWDYYVTSVEENDDLLFQYANDLQCAKKDFCLHCLYYLVGEYYNNCLAGKDDKKRKTRIDRLLALVTPLSLPQLCEWKQKTTSLLSEELKFDPQFWFNYLFLNK